MKYELFDKDGDVVAGEAGPGLQSGVLKVDNVNPWWPIGMSESPGYLYNLKVRIRGACSSKQDGRGGRQGLVSKWIVLNLRIFFQASKQAAEKFLLNFMLTLG